MKLVNLTPHEITLVVSEGELKIQPSGIVARVSVTREKVDEISVDGKIIPIYRNKFGQVEDLPNPAPDTLYIVSAIVAQAVPDRTDVVIPDDAVRDEAGRIIGARGLARV